MENDQTQPERSLPATRAAITNRTMGGTTDAPVQSTFERVQARSVNRVIETYDELPAQVVPNHDWAANLRIENDGQLAAYGQPDLSVRNGVSVSGQVQQPLPPYYDISNPLGLTADLFSKFFSQAPTETAGSPVVVGDASIGNAKSGNAGLVIVLALLAIGGYFLYKRYA